MNDLDTFRQHWIDALAAFGAHIEIHPLPEHEEYRSMDDREPGERPVRVVVVGRERVSGPVLVEMDRCRERIVQAFSDLESEARGETEEAA